MAIRAYILPWATPNMTMSVHWRVVYGLSRSVAMVPHTIRMMIIALKTHKKRPIQSIYCNLKRITPLLEVV
jgi:hypothetical protein